MMGYYYGAGNMLGFGGIFMLVFWVLVVVLVVWSIHELSGKHHHDHHYGNSANRALEILKERYAKGEVSKEEFESKKKDIE